MNRLLSLAPWILAAVTSLLLALSFGMTFPESNQNTYLVHGLVLHDPTLLVHDWYVREANDYHHIFSLFASTLFDVQDGPAPFVFFDLFFVVVTGVGLYSFVRTAAGSFAGSAAFFIWMGLATLTRTSDVMDTYIFGGYLQPSSIGTAGYFWALALHARKRFVVAGIALGIGGAFHLNFLVLGIATVGLTHVATFDGRVWTKEFWTTVLRLMAAPTLVFLWALPRLLDAASGPVAEALPILFDIRAPHHFRPTLTALQPFFLLQAAGWIVVAGHAKTRQPVPAILWRALAGVGGFVIVCSLLTTIVKIPQVAQAFPWRMAPGASMIAFVIVVAAALTGALADPSSSSSDPAPPESSSSAIRRWVSLVVAVPLVVVGTGVAWSTPERGRLYVEVVAVVVAVVVLTRLARRDLPRRLVPLAAAGLLVWAMVDGLKTFTPTISTVPAVKLQVTDWAQKHTPKDAVFAVPPDFESFRFVARRAIVVDWKSSGMLPRDVVAWADRLGTLTGRKLRSKNDAVRGYTAIDAARAQKLHEFYGVDYVVLDKRSGPIPTIGPVVHSGKRYVVQKVVQKVVTTPAPSTETP